jgi:hypothetical protein
MVGGQSQDPNIAFREFKRVAHAFGTGLQDESLPGARNQSRFGVRGGVNGQAYLRIPRLLEDLPELPEVIKKVGTQMNEDRRG